MPKIELTHIQILEYIILGIKNGQYQAAINLAQDCIDELSAQPENSVSKHAPSDNAMHPDARIHDLEEALLWCSNSKDFQKNGTAYQGWLSICEPLIKGVGYEKIKNKS